MFIKKKGAILLSVIFILLTVALIGASLVSFFSTVDLSARFYVDETKAFYLAEAGISYAIHMLKDQLVEPGGIIQAGIGPKPLGEGDFTVKVDDQQSLIISIGRVGSTEQTLQVQYSAL